MGETLKAMNTENKRCTQCKDPKYLSDFYRDSCKYDGRDTICMKCRRDQNRIAREEEAAKPKIPRGKIICERNGNLIMKGQCLPGCNEACKTCESRQEGNVGAGGEALNPEEEAVGRYDGIQSTANTDSWFS